MPNFDTPSAFVETATKCLATAVVVAPETRQRPVAGRVGVGHGLQRGKGFGRNDEEGFPGIKILGRLREVGAIDIGNETERQAALAVVLERLVGHHRPQVGTPDADIDDVPNTFAGVAQPGAAPDAVGKVSHPVQHGVDLGHHVLPVHDDDCPLGGAQGDVQNGSLLRKVDLFSPEHGVNPGPQPGLLGQLHQQLEGFAGDPVLGVIEVKAHGLSSHPLAAAGIVPKELPEVQLPNLLIVGFQGLPGRAFGEWCHARCHLRAPFVFYGGQLTIRRAVSSKR